MNHEPQLVLKNASWYSLALILQKIIAAFYFWYISRQLLVNDLGYYVFALSFATLFTIVGDLGLSTVLTRESAKNSHQIQNYLSSILGPRIFLALISYLALILFIHLGNQPSIVKNLVYLSGLVMVLDLFGNIFYSILRSQQMSFYESLGIIIQQLVISTLGIIFFYLTHSIWYLILALLLGSSFGVLYSLGLLKWKLKISLQLSFNKDTINHFIKLIPAFALSSIFVKIYNSIDPILIGYLASASAVGYYSLPLKITAVWQLLVHGIFSSSLFPAMSHYFIHSPEKLKKAFEKSFYYLIIFSLPLSFGLSFFSKEIIALLWPPSYLPSSPALAIMIFSLPFSLLAFPCGNLLNAAGREKRNAINRGIIMILSILLNIILIPFYGFIGAAITLVATAILLLVLDLMVVKRVIDWNWHHSLKIFLKSLLAIFIMILILDYFKSVFIWMILMPIGAVSYFIVLFLAGGLKITELKGLYEKVFTAHS